jgi:hypothetical protein
VTGVKPIAVSSQSISGVSANNPLVAFYNIPARKREVLFFYFVPDTTRDKNTQTSIRNNFVFIIQTTPTGSKRLRLRFAARVQLDRYII